ncbi:glycosyltransferase [Vibrio maritimus]|uniref:glycosyltransferase n=1 Tax=Vibrio maritimus TaxID=990268 RepID=UPI004067C594
MKTKILYIVSNLRQTGPVNQLFYIISNLDFEKYECRVLTLSSEPADSKLESYTSHGITVDSLSLTRLQGLFFGKFKLFKYIQRYNPDIIQTQGVRADSLAASLKHKVPWITTSRNFPIEDYPSKFGRFKGTLMAKKHLRVLSQCSALISCSNSIAAKLSTVGVPSTVISNGVPRKNIAFEKVDLCGSSKVKLITVGSLIPRKNMGLLVNLSRCLDELGFQHELTVLGDGPLLKSLESNKSCNVKFYGSVSNVDDYLAKSDFFLSSSLSEGLPNTVLEAISFGIPVVLSDIGPHREISSELPDNSSFLFSLELPPEQLAQRVVSWFSQLSKFNRLEMISQANTKFGAEVMSKKYQEIYEVVLSE